MPDETATLTLRPEAEGTCWVDPLKGAQSREVHEEIVREVTDWLWWVSV